MRRSGRDPAVRRRTARVRAAGGVRHRGAPAVAAVRAGAGRALRAGRVPAGNAILGLVAACRPIAGGAQARRRGGACRGAARRVGPAGLPAAHRAALLGGGGGDPRRRCRPRSPTRCCPTPEVALAADRARALAGRAPEPAARTCSAPVDGAGALVPALRPGGAPAAARPARDRRRPGAGPRRPTRSLVYRTAMAQARRRVARALQVLRKALPDGPTVTSVEALGRWLEEFHPRSLVELDYGGLVDLLRRRPAAGRRLGARRGGSDSRRWVAGIPKLRQRRTIGSPTGGGSPSRWSRPTDAPVSYMTVRENPCSGGSLSDAVEWCIMDPGRGTNRGASATWQEGTSHDHAPDNRSRASAHAG